MPVTLETFDQDATILIYRCEGRWTWEELGKVDGDVWAKLQGGNTRVDLIIDLTNSKAVPIGINQIVHDVGQRGWGPKREIGVFIQAPLSIQIVIHAVNRVYPEKARTYLFVDTFEEAIQLIQQSRENS